jgi:hypothetical protein
MVHCFARFVADFDGKSIGLPLTETENMENVMKRLLVMLLLITSMNLSASNLTRESHIAEQLRASAIEGEWVELQASGVDFIALRSDASVPQRRGAVILLHDMGGHPDEVGVIHSLRTQLPESGWTLLSLQMPVAAHDARATEYQGFIAESVPRIEVALAYLRTSGLLNIVMIGHGLGAAMVTNYMAGQPAVEIQGVVTIGMRLAAPDAAAERALNEQLATIRQPHYDLYGSRDLPQVLSTSKQRLSAGKRVAGQIFRQDEILGADHQFRGMSQLLVTNIAKWMARVAPGGAMTGR